MSATDSWPLTEPEEPPEEEATAILPPTTHQASLLDALREERARIAEEHHLDVMIPGWRGKIGLRLGSIPAKQIQTMVDRAQRSRSPERSNEVMADTLIAACRAVLGRVDKDQEFEPIEDSHGNPVTLDADLADLLGLDIPRPSSRGVLYALFANANAPAMALTLVHSEYMDWVRESDSDIDEEFRKGESSAAAR